MKEQVITFETAKLAKEKGFAEGSLRAYGSSTKYAMGSESFFREKGRLLNNGNGFTEAPTQSLLQKWLREEHNINVVVNSSTHNMNKKWVDWYVSVDNHCVIDHRDGLATYEAALEVGLVYALNNTITIKKVKDSWSREEVIDLIYDAMKSRNYTPVCELNKWIEENL